jgi:hypothetical protein
VADTKPCPKCGEEIKAVAVRCRYCQADLSKEAEPDFNRGAAPAAAAPAATAPAATATTATAGDFEQRFLEFAYKTTTIINAASVAYALKIPIAEADDKLEDLAARDVLVREVDDEGSVYFRLPGRAAPRGGALARVSEPGPLVPSPVSESTALVGLLLNLPMPGVGSLVAGKTREGVMQLVMGGVGLTLCVIIVGIFIGLPLMAAAWIWALMTGIKAVNEAKAAASSR